MSILIYLDPMGVKMYKPGPFQFYLAIESYQTLKILKKTFKNMNVFRNLQGTTQDTNMLDALV